MPFCYLISWFFTSSSLLFTSFSFSIKIIMDLSLSSSSMMMLNGGYISSSSNSFGSIDAPSEDLCVMKVLGASWYPASWDPTWNDLISYASYSSPWCCWVVSSWSNSDSDYVSTIWSCWRPTAAPFRYSFCCCCCCCGSTTSLIYPTLGHLLSLYHSPCWCYWNQREDQMTPLHASSTST